MVMRIKRTIDIAMSNYSGIMGFCVFTYEGHVAYASENMQLDPQSLSAILDAWNRFHQCFTMKNIPFLTAMADENGFVAINPDGAISLIAGTGKGVWFVSCFAPMDEDKNGIMRECIQSAKLLETSVSILDV
ncbi:MAG: hypothetical protein ACFE8Z_04770 [Candidatus Hermodarchaeota archaeon]